MYIFVVSLVPNQILPRKTRSHEVKIRLPYYLMCSNISNLFKNNSLNFNLYKFKNI